MPCLSGRLRPFPVAVLAMALFATACSSDERAAPVNTVAVTQPPTTSIDPDTPTADGVLRIGVLYPQTGGQADLGPAMRAAGELALADLNEAGGVLGQPVEVIFADAGDATTDTASASLDRLAAAKVDVIIAPPSSGVTSLVLDKVARSGAVLISSANPPAEAPSEVPYLQLAPSLELLGQAVGERLAAKGLPSALIVARDDPFGQRVSAAAATALKAKGVTATVQRYNPEAEVYTADVANALAAGPAQVVFVGYAEVADFLSGFIARGVLPANFPLYVVSDRLDNALFRRFTQPGILNGLRAIGLGSEVESRGNGFAQRLVKADPAATNAAFAAPTYDAVVVAALAAAKSVSDAPLALREAAPSVTGGTKGDRCADEAACLAMLASGRQDVTYAGQGGPYRLDQQRLATAGTFAEFPMGSDNRLATGQAEAFRTPQT